MFETAADYHELNAGAHRNPPRILTAPLLVRHLVFWTNPDPQDPSGTPKTPKEIKVAVDKYILALCHGLDPTKAPAPNKVTGEAAGSGPEQKKDSDRNTSEASGEVKTGTTAPPSKTGSTESSKAAVVSGLQLHPNISGILLLFDTKCDASSYSPTTKQLNQRQQDIFSSTSRAVWVQFVWKRLDVMIRFEVHTEYFSMSIFVELDKDPEKTLAAGGSYSDLDELNRQIEITLEFFKQRNTLEKRQEKRDEAKRKEDGDTAGNINKYFFHTFWDNTFSKEILNKASAEATSDKIRDAASTKATEAKFFKRIFGDFRGLILSEQVVEFDHYGKEIERARKFTWGEDKFTWGEDAKASFLPLIQHPERESRYECTVNYLLDGRAFYMSTLGPQTPSLPPEQRIPVEFILYANQRSPKRPRRVAVGPPAPDNSKSIVNQWQLGRLVSQFLLLGTLRLCALKDVKLLREASQALSTLDDSTEEARKAIARKEDAEKKKRNKNRRKRIARKNMGSGSSEIKAGESGAAESGTEAGAGTDSSDYDADVMDRIAQAHQELNGINRRFLEYTGKGLLYRVERSRYYVQQFDDNVKLLRIKRVEGDQPYDQLIRRRLGSEFDFIDRLGIRYERARGTIVTLDQNYLAIKANQIDEDIRTIQMWGEFVLFLALVPYYITHLLVLIFGEEKASLMAVNVWLLCGALALAKHYTIWRHAPGLADKISGFVPASVKNIGVRVRSIVPDWVAGKINQAVGKPRSVLWGDRIRTAAILAVLLLAVLLLAVLEFFTVSYQQHKPLEALKRELEKGNCYLAQGLRILEKSGPVAPVDCEKPQPKPAEHKVAPGASKHELETPKPAPTGQPGSSTTDSSTPSSTSAPPAAQEVQPGAPKAQSETPPVAEPATASPPPPNVKGP